MKKLFTLALAIFSLSVMAQTDVVLRFEHTMGGEPLEFNQAYTHPDDNYDFNITRLEYYVSEISIVHDGGQVTPVEDTWLLVDASKQGNFGLGQHAITNVEGISFYIGVDHLHNHLDPTTFPAGHPLAPQDPSMHWGWTAGYRFACLEGKTGAGLFFIYQVHALGDNNYFEMSLPTAAVWEGGTLVIILQADYFGLYTDIDVSGGIIEHGDAGIPVTLLENFSDEVYSQILFTGISDTGLERGFGLYPNPSYSGSSEVRINLPSDGDYDLLVSDISGRTVSRKNVTGNGSQPLDISGRGMYFVRLYKGGELLHSEKLIIAR